MVTLDDLIRRMAKRHGRGYSGTVSAGTPTSIADNNLIEPSSYWQNAYAYLFDGPAAGQERLVTVHDQLTKSVTLDPALSASPVAGNKFLLSSRRRDDYLTAVQGAVAAAGDQWVQIKDQTFTVSPEQMMAYPLPADVLFIYQIWSVQGAQPWQEPLTAWEISGAPGAYKLIMKSPGWIGYRDPVLTIAADQIRIVYAALPNVLAAGTDTLGIATASALNAETFVEEYALYLLNMAMFSQDLTGERARGALTAANTHKEGAEEARRRMSADPVQTKVRTRKYPRQI